MEIHKPRPVHGWKEFLTEIVVIVIGVLIALTAEQIVENLRWAERIRETKEHLRAELHLIAVDALAQQSVVPCDRVMVHTLERALADSDADWRPPYVETTKYPDVPFDSPSGRWEMPDGKSVLAAPRTRWDTQAWRNAQADGTANHMSKEDNMAFGRLYELVGRAKTLSDQLQADMGELNALYLPQRLDPASRAQYLRVMGRVRAGLSYAAPYNVEILERAEKLNVAKPRLEEAAYIGLYQSFCRQFHEGKTDIVYEIPKVVFAAPPPLPPE